MEERAYSPRSLITNNWALKFFITWCADYNLILPDQITKSALEDYQKWLFFYKKKNGESLKVTTQRNRLNAVQRFFKWLHREKIIPSNPAEDLELPRKPARHLPKALSRNEVEALFTIPNPSDTLGLRDRCILEVFYSCGLRRAEVANLDVGNMDLSRGTLTVIEGKHGKSRMLPLGERTLTWLETYMEKSRPRLEIDQTERALFLSGYGERLSISYIGHWVKKAMTTAGITKVGACHLLRHSCATHMLENGADIRFIQQMLGHANLGTTSIYTEVCITHLQEVHARTHPHAR